MGRLRDWMIARAANVLTKPRRHYHHALPTSAGTLRHTLEKGDVVLVDGEQRISEVIKYLTQSTWSHVALYVGDELIRRHPAQRAALHARFGDDAHHLLIEALMEGGVVASPLAKYSRFNVRVCRPRGLRSDDLDRILDETLAQLGTRYDVRTVLSLARYFFPVSLIPARWRRTALERGAPLTREVICSSLLARAFQNVGFPIVPTVDPAPADTRATAPGWFRRAPEPYAAVFHRQPPRLVTPRDFDLSPYFEILKFPPVEATTFDYKRIRWA